MKHLLLVVNIILCSVSLGSCWQYFTPVSEITLHVGKKDIYHIHSDYIYGACKKTDVVLYAHVYLDHFQVLGKLIIRGWLKLMRIPTCIVLRAKSYEEDLFRSTAFNFQMCVPRISYCYSHDRYKYYYYEWYVPYEYDGGMNWEIFFFGPPTLEWQ